MMKRTCFQKNTTCSAFAGIEDQRKLNTDEQNTCEFHPDDILFNERPFDQKDIQHVKSFVRMNLGGICFLIFMLIFGFACDKSVDTDEELLGKGSGGGGVSKDALVLMADGINKRINEVKIGDMISSDDGSARELIDIITGYDEIIYSVSTKSGNRIFVVGGQPIKSTAGWITCDELKVGMQINGINGIETIDIIFSQPYNDKIYNLMFSEGTAFVANGFVIGDFNISLQLFRGEL